MLPSELAFSNANEIRVVRRVMAFGALTVLVAVTSAGVLPALRSTRMDLVDALKSGGRTSTAPRGERRALVDVVGDVTQVGLDDRFGDLEYYRSWDPLSLLKPDS